MLKSKIFLEGASYDSEIEAKTDKILRIINRRICGFCSDAVFDGATVGAHLVAIQVKARLPHDRSVRFLAAPL